ncbi:hypothetical protein KZZ20_07760 [Methylacidiphilum fumariolicum]|uniref:Uncharacterized protein n=2 Tax=Candidatus Methylacidiphilum fumarolicum TaxID=591154 RepID=I0JXR6_METFB|nr:hypothetical protein [Candidatus Methylacidiphilum fumarolicum]MBW6415405.1 hypothetical protein [Candidatus Methylacidiphilum fumarolicum]CAI9086360.1 conserved protein of unknown function [Candidatus Methylacidiphilum fumarolicum]CCG92035.1 hypothetical protein MFUM_290039 [Methylacidiphilum fumariolicum SolV]
MKLIRRKYNGRKVKTHHSISHLRIAVMKGKGLELEPLSLIFHRKLREKAVKKIQASDH